MQPGNKHKIFSKEEFFKMLDEKRSLPPEADDFDKEALEGLSMLSDRKKIDGLSNSIDEVLRIERAKTRKRKNLYFLSAAAALILIVGLFFILKENSFEKKENALAENAQAMDNTTKVDEPKASDESAPDEKKVAEEKSSSPATTVTGEGKENPVDGEAKSLSTELSVQNSKGPGPGALPPVPPAEVASAQTKVEMKKQADADAENASGKDYKTTLAKQDQLKREEAEKTNGIIDDKEKDKTRYVTNTVWTSTPASGSGGAVDESKNKSADYRSKAQDSKDGNSVVGNNADTYISQNNGESVAFEKESGKSTSKKRKSNKGEPAKPDSIVTDMLAGYSYQEKKPENGALQGGAPDNSPQTTQPVQTQNEVAAFGSATQNRPTDIPDEQKLLEESAGKKGGKHEQGSDTKAATLQASESQSPSRGNAALEAPEFKGGDAALRQYLKKNLKISEPKRSGIIEAEFIVTKEGKIDTSTVKISSKIKDCNPCSEDVKKVVKTMPKWKPAQENGKAASRKQKISVEYNADAAK